jgi:hypothetical protein
VKHLVKLLFRLAIVIVALVAFVLARIIHQPLPLVASAGSRPEHLPFSAPEAHCLYPQLDSEFVFVPPVP